MEENTGIEQIKRDIYEKHLPGYKPPEKRKELKQEDFDSLKHEADEYRQEIESLKTKVKDLFRENNRLRERVAELEGGRGPEPGKAPSWQKLLGKRE